MLKRQPLKNIFSDRSSMILRALLRNPDQSWVITAFEKHGVTPMLASMVFKKAETSFYLQRFKAGRNSYSRLIHGKFLIKDWLKTYRFDQNIQVWFQYSGDHFLEKIKDYFEKHQTRFALTLFSGSRLISPYVNDSRHFLYMDKTPQEAESMLNDLKEHLSLTEVPHGGNVCIALPFYKTAIFQYAQKIDSFPVVSTFQLYLDLMGYPPLGSQEAFFMVERLKARKVFLPWLKFL